MKEKVDLNNNGLSIESTARILHRGKWVKRHILCKKHVDLNHPILFVYKNKKDKQKNVYKFSLVMNNYIGYESGFEYKKRRNTLSVITSEVCLMLSFDLAESLIVWEAWLKNICGQTVAFYMQLKKIPSAWKNNSALLKEVRCHVKEGHLGIVYSRPQEVILVVDLRKERVEVDDNNLITIHLDGDKPEEKVVLLCPKSAQFKRCLGAARMEGALAKLLNREQFEGDWMPREEKPRSLGDHTSQFTVNMSDLASLMRTPEPQHNHRVGNSVKLAKGMSKSGYFPPRGYYPHADLDYENLPYRPLSRANSTAAYYNTVTPKMSMNNAASVNYVNIGPGYYGHYGNERKTTHDALANKTSVPSTKSVDEGPIYCNLEHDHYMYPEEEHTYEEIGAGGVGRSFSMPDYVNVHISGGVIHILDHTDPESHYENHEVLRRRSNNSVHSHNIYPSTSRGMGVNRNRSNPDFKSPPTEQQKHENWRRAKKFFSAFKPKSQTDLLQRRNKNRQSIIKSSSTGALQFFNSVHMFNRSSTSSENDEMPPALNMSCHQMTRSHPHLSGMSHPPQGLIHAPNDIVLTKSRSGVGAILARRKIRGSFTKYDGERATHMYPGQQTSKEPKEDSIQEEEEPKKPEKVVKPPPPRPPKVGKLVDGIASAVNRGQEKLKWSDRRASNVSFNKVNVNGDLPEGAAATENEESDSRPTSRADSLPEAKKLTTLAIVNPSGNSNSPSDYTRSSNESLSSDARSRISIRKKRTSPPLLSAPDMTSQTSLHNIQPHIRLIPTSSMESCNSEQTARSFSPRSAGTRKTRNGTTSNHSLATASSHQTVYVNYCDLALPLKPPTASSSSSLSSKKSNTDYIVIDPVTTQAVQMTNSQQSLQRSREKSSSMSGVAIVRRKSQGQAGSSASDSMSVDQPPKQGFFKKYRKVRRNRRQPAGSSSMTQLNI